MEDIFESLKTFVPSEEHLNNHTIIVENTGSFLGLKHSEESKKLMSEAKIGRKRSLEARQAISNGKKGKPRSEETKEKIRQANLGKKRSAETIRKLRESHLGHKITPEESLARSIRMTGKKRGPYKLK